MIHKDVSRKVLNGSYIHCVKSVCIRSYSGPHFPAFGLNTKRYSVPLRIQSECGEMRTRTTPNTDTFYAVIRRDSKKIVPHAKKISLLKEIPLKNFPLEN